MGFRDFLAGARDRAEDTVSGGADSARGAADSAFDFATDVTGAEEYAQSDEAAQARGEIQQATERGGWRGYASAFDTATQAGFDFALDNPNASVQDSSRRGIEFATGVESEDQGEAAQDLAGRASGAVGGAIEGTAFDNPVTDAVGTGLDIFVAEPAKAGVTAATGIDVDEGTTDGTVGAIDAFDLGVTAGTAGLGAVGLRAARGAARGAGGADDAGGFASRYLSRGSDDAARGADDATQGVDRGSGVVTDGGTDVFNPRNMPVLARGADEAAVVADDAARGADEVARAAEESGRVLDEGASALDDATRVSSRVMDDVLRGSDEAARVTDDAARGADEAARAADEGTSVAQDATQAGILSGFGRAGAGLADDVGGAFGRISDEAARGADEATGVIGNVTGSLSRLTDDVLRASDDAARGADDAARGADDAARGADDAARGADEAARGADEVAQAGDESAGALSRMLGTTTGKVAAVGGGALAGGALLESLGTFDRLEVSDPETGETYALVREKEYQPTERHDGGLLFEVKTGSDGSYRNSQGYTVMLGASGRNVYILDSDGERTRAQVPVETFQEAAQRARGTAPGAGGTA